MSLIEWYENQIRRSSLGCKLDIFISIFWFLIYIIDFRFPLFFHYGKITNLDDWIDRYIGICWVCWNCCSNDLSILNRHFYEFICIFIILINEQYFFLIYVSDHFIGDEIICLESFMNLISKEIRLGASLSAIQLSILFDYSMKKHSNCGSNSWRKGYCFVFLI